MSTFTTQMRSSLELDFIRDLLLEKEIFEEVMIKKNTFKSYKNIIKMFIHFKNFLNKTKKFLFELDNIAKTLYEILSTMTPTYIKSLDKICADIIKSFNGIDILLIDGTKALDIQTKANIILLDISSFYTMIADKDCEENIRRLINAVIGQVNNTIKLYEHALTPDDNVLTTIIEDEEAVPDNEIILKSDNEIFNPEMINTKLKFITDKIDATSGNNLDLIVSQLYDILVENELFCEKQSEVIQYDEFRKMTSKKETLLKCQHFEKARFYIKQLSSIYKSDPIVYLIQLLSLKDTSEKYRENIPKKDNFHKLLSSFFVFLSLSDYNKLQMKGGLNLTPLDNCNTTVKNLFDTFTKQLDNIITYNVLNKLLKYYTSANTTDIKEYIGTLLFDSARIITTTGDMLKYDFDPTNIHTILTSLYKSSDTDTIIANIKKQIKNVKGLIDTTKYSITELSKQITEIQQSVDLMYTTITYPQEIEHYIVMLIDLLYFTFNFNIQLFYCDYTELTNTIYSYLFILKYFNISDISLGVIITKIDNITKSLHTIFKNTDPTIFNQMDEVKKEIRNIDDAGSHSLLINKCKEALIDYIDTCIAYLKLHNTGVDIKTAAPISSANLKMTVIDFFMYNFDIKYRENDDRETIQTKVELMKNYSPLFVHWIESNDKFFSTVLDNELYYDVNTKAVTKMIEDSIKVPEQADVITKIESMKKDILKVKFLYEYLTKSSTEIITKVNNTSFVDKTTSCLFTSLIEDKFLEQSFKDTIYKENKILQELVNDDSHSLYMVSISDANSDKFKTTLCITMYTLLNIICNVKIEAFAKYRVEMMKLYVFTLIMFNHSYHYLLSQLQDPDVSLINRKIIKSIYLEGYKSKIFSILKARKDDSDVPNPRYTINNIDKERNILEVVYYNTDKTYDEINHILQDVTDEDKASVLKEYTQCKLSIVELDEHNESYEKCKTYLEDNQKLYELENSKELYYFGSFDKYYDYSFTNRTITDDLYETFKSNIESGKTTAIMSFGQSGSGKTSTLVYFNTPQVKIPGIIFLLLNKYQQSVNDITSVQYTVWNIYKKDTEKKDKYDLANIDKWDVNNFFDVKTFDSDFSYKWSEHPDTKISEFYISGINTSDKSTLRSLYEKCKKTLTDVFCKLVTPNIPENALDESKKKYIISTSLKIALLYIEEIPEDMIESIITKYAKLIKENKALQTESYDKYTTEIIQLFKLLSKEKLDDEEVETKLIDIYIEYSILISNKKLSNILKLFIILHKNTKMKQYITKFLKKYIKILLSILSSSNITPEYIENVIQPLLIFIFKSKTMFMRYEKFQTLKGPNIDDKDWSSFMYTNILYTIIILSRISSNDNNLSIMLGVNIYAMLHAIINILVKYKYTTFYESFSMPKTSLSVVTHPANTDMDATKVDYSNNDIITEPIEWKTGVQNVNGIKDKIEFNKQAYKQMANIINNNKQNFILEEKFLSYATGGLSFKKDDTELNERYSYEYICREEHYLVGLNSNENYDKAKPDFDNVSPINLLDKMRGVILFILSFNITNIHLIKDNKPSETLYNNFLSMTEILFFYYYIFGADQLTNSTLSSKFSSVLYSDYIYSQISTSNSFIAHFLRIIVCYGINHLNTLSINNNIIIVYIYIILFIYNILISKISAITNTDPNKQYIDMIYIRQSRDKFDVPILDKNQDDTRAKFSVIRCTQNKNFFPEICYLLFPGSYCIPLTLVSHTPKAFKNFTGSDVFSGYLSFLGNHTLSEATKEEIVNKIISDGVDVKSGFKLTNPALPKMITKVFKEEVLFPSENKYPTNGGLFKYLFNIKLGYKGSFTKILEYIEKFMSTYAPEYVRLYEYKLLPDGTKSEDAIKNFEFKENGFKAIINGIYQTFKVNFLMQYILSVPATTLGSIPPLYYSSLNIGDDFISGTNIPLYGLYSNIFNLARFLIMNIQSDTVEKAYEDQVFNINTPVDFLPLELYTDFSLGTFELSGKVYNSMKNDVELDDMKIANRQLLHLNSTTDKAKNARKNFEKFRKLLMLDSNEEPTGTLVFEENIIDSISLSAIPNLTPIDSDSFEFLTEETLYKHEEKHSILMSSVLSILNDTRIRQIAPTVNNSESSRSHALVNIKFNTKQQGGTEKSNNIVLCDLAGVENSFTCDEINTLYRLLYKYDEYIASYPDKKLEGRHTNTKQINGNYIFDTLLREDRMNIPSTNQIKGYQLTLCVEIASTSFASINSRKLYQLLVSPEDNLAYPILSLQNESVLMPNTISNKKSYLAKANISQTDYKNYDVQLTLGYFQFLFDNKPAYFLINEKEYDSTLRFLVECLLPIDMQLLHYNTAVNITNGSHPISYNTLSEAELVDYIAEELTIESMPNFFTRDTLKGNVNITFVEQLQKILGLTELYKTNMKDLSIPDLQSCSKYLNESYIYGNKPTVIQGLNPIKNFPYDTYNSHLSYLFSEQGDKNQDFASFYDKISSLTFYKNDTSLTPNITYLSNQDRTFVTYNSKTFMHNENANNNLSEPQNIQLHYFILTILSVKELFRIKSFGSDDGKDIDFYYLEKHEDYVTREIRSKFKGYKFKGLSDIFGLLSSELKASLMYNIYYDILATILKEYLKFLRCNCNLTKEKKGEYNKNINTIIAFLESKKLHTPEEIAKYSMTDFFKFEDIVKALNPTMILIFNEYLKCVVQVQKVNSLVNIPNMLFTPDNLFYNISNISKYYSNLARYNCKFAQIEGYSINRALYELNNDLSYISRYVSLNSGPDKIFNGIFTEQTCKMLTFTDDGLLDNSEIESHNYGILLKVLIKIIQGKITFESTSMSQKEIEENLSKLQLLTFTVIHLSNMTNNKPVNNPPTPPYVNITQLKKYILLFKNLELKCKYHKHEYTLLVYYERLKAYYVYICDLMKIFLEHHSIDFYKAELIKSEDLFNMFQSEDIKSVESISQIQLIINRLYNEIIFPIENINSLSLIGSLDSTQAIIDSYSSYSCSTAGNKFSQPKIEQLEFLPYIKNALL